MAAKSEPKNYPVVIFDGDKGGVGKSTACGAFVDWCIKHGIPVGVVDGDSRNPDVHRMFEGAVPVIRADLRIHAGWMDMTDFQNDNPGSVIVASMPAGVGKQMEFEAPRLLEAMEHSGRSISLAWLINRSLDSINLLNEATKAFGPKLSSRFVLKNLFFGNEDSFLRWRESKTRKEFESAGGVTLNFPELHERVMDKLFSSAGQIVPYSDALVDLKDLSSSAHGLTASEVAELRYWLGDAGIAFKVMAEKMGLMA